MAKQITLYVDDETEKLLKEDTEKSYSKIFKKALEEELKNLKSMNEEIDKLPSEDYIKDVFKQLPSTNEINKLAEAFENLPSEGQIKDAFNCLPTLKEMQELNSELDKVLEKTKKIKKLEELRRKQK